MLKEKVDLKQKVKSKFNVRIMEIVNEDPESVARKEALNIQAEQ